MLKALDSRFDRVYGLTMIEPRAKTVPRPLDDDPPPSPADFPGCRAVTLRREELGDYEGSYEYWDARTETAMVVAELSVHHDYPSARLGRLVNMIALWRGSPIDLLTTVDLVVRDREGARQRIMQADRLAYLHPREISLPGPFIEVGEDELPDVVLEVDYSTDVRRRKLGLYASWGFPELWVEVPEAPWAGRPKSRPSGLTIHVLEGGGYVATPSSRAFPGWTAQEIHTALNEPEPSPETVAVLRRVGGALGAMEGTSPDDDLFLRQVRAESHARGDTRGRLEGRLEGRREGRLKERREILRTVVPQAFATRGVAVSPALAAALEESAASTDAAKLIRLAYECRDEEEFLRGVRSLP